MCSCALSGKAVPEMTIDTMLRGTLNPTHSLTHSLTHCWCKHRRRAS